MPEVGHVFFPSKYWRTRGKSKVEVSKCQKNKRDIGWWAFTPISQVGRLDPKLPSSKLVGDQKNPLQKPRPRLFASKFQGSGKYQKKASYT